MKIGIIGGGYSSVLLALLIKQKNKNNDVLIFEKNDQIAKKTKATGNGKCNINTIDDNPNKFNNPLIVEKLIKKYPLNIQIKTLNDLGIPTKILNKEGLYPISESANNVVEILKQQLFLNKVIVHLETGVLDYKINDKNVTILTNKGVYAVDKLIIAVGGKSSPNLGSDGNFIDVIKQHGYKFYDFKAGLCPIKVKENIKSLFGQRMKANVRLLVDEKCVYQEEGEVNFKKDGLSGIVMMDIASIIARNNYKKDVSFHLSLLPSVDLQELTDINKVVDNPLLCYVGQPIADYIYKINNIKPKINLTNNDIVKLCSSLNDLKFTFDSLYDFKDSQVSIGGVSLDEVDDQFISKHEKNVFFAGEILNIDGLCGGYNMKWCLLTCLAINDAINN